MFINEDDLNKSLYEEIIDAVTRKQSDRVEYGIRTAQAIVESYLAGRYDTSQLFAKQGDERNYLVVDICANLALYIIADVLEAMPVTIQNPRDESMELLKDLQSGSAFLPGVPEAVDPDTGEPDTYIRYGEITKNRY